MKCIGESCPLPPTMAQQESMRDMLEKPISQLQALSQSMFSAMSSGQLPDPPIAALAACDASLAEAMRLVRIHLLKQKQIEQLMDEVCELDSQLVEVVDGLSKGQRELQAIIDEGEDRITSAEKATGRMCISSRFYSDPLTPFFFRSSSIFLNHLIWFEAGRLYLCSSKCSYG